MARRPGRGRTTWATAQQAIDQGSSLFDVQALLLRSGGTAAVGAGSGAAVNASPANAAAAAAAAAATTATSTSAATWTGNATHAVQREIDIELDDPTMMMDPNAAAFVLLATPPPRSFVTAMSLPEHLQRPYPSTIGASHTDGLNNTHVDGRIQQSLPNLQPLLPAIPLPLSQIAQPRLFLPD